MKKLGFLLFMSSGIAYGMGELKRSLAERYAQEEHRRAVSTDSFVRNLRRQSNQPQTSTSLKTKGYSSDVVDPNKCGSGTPVRRKKNQYNE